MAWWLIGGLVVTWAFFGWWCLSIRSVILEMNHKLLAQQEQIEQRNRTIIGHWLDRLTKVEESGRQQKEFMSAIRDGLDAWAGRIQELEGGQKENHQTAIEARMAASAARSFQPSIDRIDKWDSRQDEQMSILSQRMDKLEAFTGGFTIINDAFDTLVRWHNEEDDHIMPVTDDDGMEAE